MQHGYAGDQTVVTVYSAGNRVGHWRCHVRNLDHLANNGSFSVGSLTVGGGWGGKVILILGVGSPDG
jgi:hypothetical protein